MVANVIIAIIAYLLGSHSCGKFQTKVDRTVR